MVRLEDFEDIATLQISTTEELGLIRGALPVTVVERCQTFLAQTPSNLTPYAGLSRCLHGDLSPEHLLLDPGSGRVTALIDWADACLGDPAYDLKFLWTWLGEGFVDRLSQSRVELVDVGLRDRVRFYGVCTAVGEVAYGLATGRAANLRQGIAALNWTFG